LSKRSSSNLDTIVESHAQSDNKNQIVNAKAINRQTSKAQPIPMQNNFQLQLTQNQQLLQQQPASNLQLQRYSNELTQINDESSADENNSSSVASTPDTIYYFKLKSAAFVPSASFTNNFYGGSSSIGNLANDTDIPPFITLLSNDFANLSDSEKQVAHLDPHQMAQSPPPPQNMLEYNFQNPQKSSLRQIKYRNDSVSSQRGSEDQMSSPCSLPNFKMLDNYNTQYLNANNSNNYISNTNESPKNFNQITATSMMTQQPDDFVFVESVMSFSYVFKLDGSFKYLNYIKKSNNKSKTGICASKAMTFAMVLLRFLSKLSFEKNVKKSQRKNPRHF
jgi:hypothetical protein